MDGQRFDAVVQAAAGATRRGALRALAGGLLAGAVGVGRARGAAAQNEAVGPGARCGKRGERCTRTADCCHDLACDGRVCRDRCRRRGERCSRDSECCASDDLICRDDTCESCRERGDGCARDAECCGALACRERSCQDPCGGRGERCVRDGDCCAETYCQSGRCAACLRQGERCRRDVECCGELACRDGQCGRAFEDAG